jgi:hypothetical protein
MLFLLEKDIHFCQKECSNYKGINNIIAQISATSDDQRGEFVVIVG